MLMKSFCDWIGVTRSGKQAASTYTITEYEENILNIFRPQSSSGSTIDEKEKNLNAILSLRSNTSNIALRQIKKQFLKNK